MEEDIKILEDYIKSSREFEKEVGLEEIFEGIQWKRRIDTIENILKRYKELEEENKTLTDEYMIQKHLINADFLKDYIPISVIQNKIDELSNNEEDYQYIISKTNRIIYKIDIIDILQELLNERK